MKSDEIRKLRNASLLALKSYFALSLSEGWEEHLDMRQMQAAWSMHNAACSEIETTQLEFMGFDLLEHLDWIRDELDSILESKQINRKKLTELRTLVQEIISDGTAIYFQATKDTDGGPTA